MSGTLQLPTTGTLSGLAAVQDINAANSALAALNQGGTAPTPASTGLSSTAGLLWHDTTTNLLKLRDQADTNWMVVGSVDETNKGLTPYYQGVALPTFMRGYLAGLTLSNDSGTPNTKLDVSPGVCVDDTGAAMMNLGSGVIDCTTVGANGLDAGSLAATTWYHAFAICKASGGAPTLLASTSLASPTLPSGYTLKRRLGSFRTDGSSHILGFSQNGDEFLWAAAMGDVNVANLGTTATLFTLTVPASLRCNALFRAFALQAAVGTLVLLNSLDENSVAANSPAGNDSIITQAANIYVGGHFNLRTNTSGQIRAVSSAASTALLIATYGWIDYRGRFS